MWARLIGWIITVCDVRVSGLAIVLRKQQPRKLVEESFLFFECERYDLGRFVIMSNHGPFVASVAAGDSDSQTIDRNDAIHCTRRKRSVVAGRNILQSEPLDHAVGSEAQFEYLQQYIVNNPKKAGLSNGEYTLWVRPK